MKNRLFILGVLIVFRYILGFMTTAIVPRNVVVRVIGKPVLVSQYTSKCIMKIGNFLFEGKEFCADKEYDKMAVVGRVNHKLPDVFWGDLWLDNQQITVLSREVLEKNYKSRLLGQFADFRSFLVARMENVLPSDEAGLLAGIVLGYKKGLGDRLYQAMIESGSIHIAVASGYNVLLLAGWVMSMCFLFSRRGIAIYIVVVIMVIYSLLAGADPPVVRASVMASLLLVGQNLGRGGASSWFLWLAGGVMLLIDPGLVANVSFQLSMAASVGVIIWQPNLLAWLEGRWGKAAVWLGEMGVLSTVSTMILTMPIIWWNFSRLSLIGILSNILILPLVPPLMILGVAVLVLPKLFLWPAYGLAHLLVRIIYFFER